MKRLLTIKEFCTMHAVCRTKAYQLIERGEIKAVKIGRSTRITVESADRWFRSLRRGEDAE